MRKVPEITLMFWVMKVCATTLGETAGDLLSMTMNVGYAVSSLVLLGFFVMTVAAQLASRSYHPLLYWAVILSTSTAGTTMSDFMDRTLGLGYATGAVILAAILCAILALWHMAERSLDVDRAMTRRAELFYWTAILVSNTLGTALGDFLADSSGLGFVGGALLIGGLLALVIVAAFTTKIPRVALFWTAFVLTRPLGATVGDVLTKSPDSGGIGLGTTGSSAILGSILVALVLYAMWRQQRARRQPLPLL